MKTQNQNRVPQKQWRKWSAQARAVFNRCYQFFHDNPKLMQHPKAGIPKLKFWKTTAWNASWIAADAVDNTIPTEFKTV